MKLQGIRIHITGSAAEDVDGALLEAANGFVVELAGGLVAKGAGLVLGVAGEPRGDHGPYVFDWTALGAVADWSDPAPAWPTGRVGRFFIVASQRALEKIPEWRSELWQACRSRSDFFLKVTPTGWKMASLIRREQAREGDVLIVVGGGAGAERLAQIYLDEGKPVIPINSNLGSFSEDGRGGAKYLYEEALSDTDNFFRLVPGGGNSTARLSELELTSLSDARELSNVLISIVADLRPRRAFYVRLMTHDHQDYPSVEEHFRDVVDPVMENIGFEPHEVGRHDPISAFINVEIFEGIHRAGVVIIDLTGVRPNCMMELGYALGRRRNVVLSAKHETSLPFDSDKLPTYFWSDQDPALERQQSFNDWFDRYVGLPPVID